MKRLTKLYLLVVIGVFILSGCGGKEMKADTPIQDWNAPKWVVNGSGAFGGERGKVFYGIGSAVGIKNASLMRTAADNRARNEIAKVFQFYTASLMKDYAASTMAGDVKVTAEEQHVEQAIKTVTAMTFSGVEVVDHWQHPATGELYSLARLDLETFKNNLERVKELDAKVRDYIRKNAEKLHQELEVREKEMQAR
ncbi:MAG: LPP20 family lipoprotein [Deltaproteobacteria bacterium]|nr:LPP20 family lipoprotein [Deltaproteobacteria bacterium]